MAEIQRLEDEDQRGLLHDEEANQLHHPQALPFQIDALVFQRPWLFRTMPMSRLLNITGIFTIPYMVSITVLGLWFLKSRDPRWLLLILCLDIVFNLLSILVCFAYKDYMDINQDNVTRFYLAEPLLITSKGCMLYLWWLFINKQSPSSLPHLILLCCLLLVFANAGLQYKRLYIGLLDSSNLSLVFLLIMLGYKLTGSKISWTETFLLQIFIGYFLLIFFLVIGIVLLVALVGLTYLRIFHIIYLNILMTFGRYISQAFLYLGIIQFACPNGSYWVGDIWNILIVFSVMSNLEYLCYLINQPTLDLQTLFEKADNPVVKKQVLDTALNLIQKSPTFFSYATGTPVPESRPEREGGDEDEPPLCFICMTKEPNCVVFDCLHGGMCSECAENALKKNPDCTMCKQKVNKIAVIKQRPDGKYDVLEEIYIKSD